jgi:hypothetical protein
MATYYFSSLTGSDANNGTSAETAKASLDVFLAAGSATFGDTLLLKRGEVQIVANRNLPSGASATSPTKLQAYGEALVPYAYVKAGASIGLNISQRSNILYEDLYFDANGYTRNLYIAATSSGASTGHTIRRCYFTGSTGDNPGLSIIREATSNTSTNHLIEDCVFFNNSGSGVTLQGVQGATLRRCVAYKNGATASGGGHGLHTQSRYTTISSGWALVSGNIYKRTLAAHETTITYVRHPSYLRMVVAGVATSPNAGEFGVSAGELYVNVGGSPNGSSMDYIWNVTTNILYEDCISWGNYYGVAPFQEGHGFSFDDWVSNSIMRRCISYNNEGYGISINQGDNNRIEHCLVYGNAARGLNGSTGTGNTVYNCSFIKNNRGRGASTAELIFQNDAANATIKNCIVETDVAIGINFGTASGCISDYNAIYGPSDLVSGGTETNTITTSPQLSTTFVPKSTSPVRNAGIYVGYTKDLESKFRHNPPTIGAYEYVAERADAGTRGVR